MTRYQPYFIVHRRDTTPTARQDLDGLVACEKGQANMERMEEEVEGSAYTPLLSVRDARLLIIARLWGTKQDVEKRIQQMEKRHQKRQLEIDRHYRAPTNR